MNTNNAILTLSGKAHALAWDFGAIYRLYDAGLERALSEISGERAFKATVDLLWAMLPEGSGYDSPHGLARAISTEGLEVQALVSLLNVALGAATAPTAEKKTAFNTSPSPGLS